MNRTVTINISGIIFHIDEDAFEHLSAYLAAIKSCLGTADGGAEVMGDIEARIAELLQQRLGTARQVVGMNDVDHIREVMGQPEDFGSDEFVGAASSQEGEKISRRLFRNPDEKIIGGVCGGLAAYFDVEVVWVRLIMFLLIFFGGLSIWVYIILWIVIPEAKTTAEKFAMRGETANINNIYRSFRDEARDVKDRINKYGSEFSRNYGERVRSNVSGALYTTFGILGRLIGFFLLLLGTSLLIAYVASLTGIGLMGESSFIDNWKQAIFTSPSDYYLAVISFILVAGIPILVLIYGGLKLLFRIRYSSRWLTLGFGMLWLSGVILGVFVTFDTLREFSDSAKVRESAVLSGTGDTLVVKARQKPAVLAGWQFDNNAELEDNRNRNGFLFGIRKNKLSILGYAGIDVIESSSDTAEISVTCEAQGPDKETARQNAREITYHYNIKGNELVLDELFLVAEEHKWRWQKVNIKLRLPRGNVIYFDESVKKMLDDVDNTTDTWDEDMVNRRWKMTARGLVCLDCDDLIDADAHNKSENRIMKERVIINSHGIKVNDEDTRIRITDEGLSVHNRNK